MTRKERKIIINVIKNKNIYDKLFIEYLANKYSQKNTNKSS